MKKLISILAIFSLILLFGCSSDKNETTQGNTDTKEQQLKKITIMLDWFPNTNHTGLYVAKEKGYFKEAGLEAEILQPGENASVDSMIASGKIDFGVSYQEGITQARVKDVPIVSIAAVIQHNTSGFASLKSAGITSAKDLEGKKYGGWGSPAEEAVINAVMNQANADPSKVEIVNVGATDFFKAIGKDADFMWIYYGWDGVEAKRQGIDINTLMLKDLHPALDYYTPVLATNEKMINENPETVKKFMEAVSKGYQFAIDNPEEAANILIKANPELNADLVKASQKWLSPRYQDDADQWGVQKEEVWQGYGDWMYDQGLIEKKIEPNKAFTNDFLPSKS